VVSLAVQTLEDVLSRGIEADAAELAAWLAERREGGEHGRDAEGAGRG
jgi:hypothetical protein